MLDIGQKRGSDYLNKIVETIQTNLKRDIVESVRSSYGEYGTLHDF